MKVSLHRHNSHIAIITIDNTTKMNALTRQMMQELGKLWDELEEDDTRCIIITGTGERAFCAGADINMMRDAGAKSPEENRTDSERLDRLFNSLWSHPCFTIGKIQGVALGGGAGLIACLDHVIVEPGARIALSEGKLGILPAVIGPYVYRKVGSAEFRRLAMMAGRIGAEESLRIGLVNQLSASFCSHWVSSLLYHF